MNTQYITQTDLANQYKSPHAALILKKRNYIKLVEKKHGVRMFQGTEVPLPSQAEFNILCAQDYTVTAASLTVMANTLALDLVKESSFNYRKTKNEKWRKVWDLAQALLNNLDSVELPARVAFLWDKESPDDLDETLELLTLMIEKLHAIATDAAEHGLGEVAMIKLNESIDLLMDFKSE